MLLALVSILGLASTSAFARSPDEAIQLQDETPVAVCARKVAERVVAKSTFPQIQVDDLIETDRFIDFFDRLNGIHRFRLVAHDAEGHTFGGETHVVFSPIVIEDPLSGRRTPVRMCLAAYRSGPSVIIRNVNGTPILYEW